MAKIIFTAALCFGGYLGYVFSMSVPEPSLGLTIFGILFCALILGCVAAPFLDDTAHRDNSPSFVRRIAPLAFFYYLLNRKD